MRYTLLFILSLLCFVGTSEGRWSRVRPERGRRVTLLVDGKTRAYHWVSDLDTVVVRINGPTRLRVRTRLDIEENGKTHEYQIKVTGRKMEEKFSLTTQASHRVSYRDREGRIGRARDIYIRVPRGEHTYYFTLPGGRGVIRLHREHRWVFFSPISFCMAYKISVRERLNTYFEAVDRPIKVKLVGPTSLRVSTRVVFDKFAPDEIPYTIFVSKNGDMKNYDLKAKKSYTAKIEGMDDLVPGRLKRLELKIERGEHILEFHAPSRGPKVLFRFHIPEKDVR